MEVKNFKLMVYCVIMYIDFYIWLLLYKPVKRKMNNNPDLPYLFLLDQPVRPIKQLFLSLHHSSINSYLFVSNKLHKDII